MLGHDDPGDEVTASGVPGVVNVIDECVLDSVVIEEGELLVAGESEEADVVWILDPFHLLLGGHGPSVADTWCSAALRRGRRVRAPCGV